MPEECIYVFIDESGTLPDPNNRKIVLVAVAVADVLSFRRSALKIKANRRTQKELGGKEFKFYSAGNRSRKLYLEALSKENISIFALTIDKGLQRIPDSPVNYAVLSWLLILDCLAYFQKENLKIIFDKHFHKASDECAFFDIFKKLIRQDILTSSADSRSNPGLTAADFVAGSFLYAKSGKSTEFYEILKNKVISEKEVNWKESKKNFIAATKNLPEPVQAPIQGKFSARSQVQVPGIG